MREPTGSTSPTPTGSVCRKSRYRRPPTPSNQHEENTFGNTYDTDKGRSTRHDVVSCLRRTTPMEDDGVVCQEGASYVTPGAGSRLSRILLPRTDDGHGSFYGTRSSMTPVDFFPCLRSSPLTLHPGPYNVSRQRVEETLVNVLSPVFKK